MLRSLDRFGKQYRLSSASNYQGMGWAENDKMASDKRYILGGAHLKRINRRTKGTNRMSLLEAEEGKNGTFLEEKEVVGACFVIHDRPR